MIVRTKAICRGHFRRKHVQLIAFLEEMLSVDAFQKLSHWQVSSGDSHRNSYARRAKFNSEPSYLRNHSVLDATPKHAAAHEKHVDQEVFVLHLDGQQTNDAIVAKLVGDTNGEDSAAFGSALLREHGAAALYVVDINLIGSFGEFGEPGEVRVVRALD